MADQVKNGLQTLLELRNEEDGKKGLQEVLELRKAVFELQERNQMEIHKWDAKLRYFKSQIDLTGMQKEIKNKAGVSEFKEKTGNIEEKLNTIENRSLKSKQTLKQLESFVENLALAVKMLQQVNLIQKPENPAFAQSRGGVCLSCGADGNTKEDMNQFFQDKNSRQPLSHNMTSNNSLEVWNRTQQNFSAMNSRRVSANVTPINRHSSAKRIVPTSSQSSLIHQKNKHWKSGRRQNVKSSGNSEDMNDQSTLKQKRLAMDISFDARQTQHPAKHSSISSPVKFPPSSSFSTKKIDLSISQSCKRPLLVDAKFLKKPRPNSAKKLKQDVKKFLIKQTKPQEPEQMSFKPPKPDMIHHLPYSTLLPAQSLQQQSSARSSQRILT